MPVKIIKLLLELNNVGSARLFAVFSGCALLRVVFTIYRSMDYPPGDLRSREKCNELTGPRTSSAEIVYRNPLNHC